MKELLLTGKSISADETQALLKCIDQVDDLLLENFDFTDVELTSLAQKISEREKPVNTITMFLITYFVKIYQLVRAKRLIGWLQ